MKKSIIILILSLLILIVVLVLFVRSKQEVKEEVVSQREQYQLELNQ